MPTKRPAVVAIVSDLHAGSTLGLCPYCFDLDDGGYYKASSAQRWLWRCWKDYIDLLYQQKQLTKAKKTILIINGDLVDGDHHRTPALITKNQTTQQKIALSCLEPLLNFVDDLFIVRGTPVHVGGDQAELEEAIAEDITITVRPSKARASWYHLRLTVNGTLFDLAHHGKIGRLEWTRLNSAGKVAVTAIVRAAEYNYKHPDILIRSHFHRYYYTNNNYRTIRVISTPGWQPVTPYVHKLDPGAILDIGGLIVTCHPGGRYEVSEHRYYPAVSTPVAISTRNL